MGFGLKKGGGEEGVAVYVCLDGFWKGWRNV